MILVCGAHYGEDKATVCGSLYEEWEDVRPTQDFVVVINNFERGNSRKGEDYLWKYPCLISLFEEIGTIPDAIINYYGSPESLSPMNTVLFKSLERVIPIIGVSILEPPGKLSIPVQWNLTTLHMVTNGIDPAEARENVQKLDGEGLLPEAFLRIHLLTLEGSANLPL